MVDGKRSNTEKVLSGVPQGTVLGPLLFIMYINDIVKCIKNSYIMIFADDSKVIKAIKSLEDRQLFNEDMLAVTEWAVLNKMELNRLKYQLIQYGKNDELKLPYKIDENTVVKKSETVKDLGVLMSANMKFIDHIMEVKSKAKKVASWIFRIVESRTAETIVLLFKTYVRPILEYSCSLWSPHQVTYIAALEAIQRSVTARIQGMENLSYWERLQTLKLYSLQRRRERYDIIHIWKIQQEIIPNDLHLQFYYNPRQGWKCRRNIIQTRQRSLATVRHNSFTSRAAALFNKIPKNVKHTDSLAVLKKRLDSYLSKIPDFPPVHGYARRNNNSILDWASSRWEEEMIIEESKFDHSVVNPPAIGEELALPDPM
jgi:ribonuclease P/MRP protein subunit RPP40